MFETRSILEVGAAGLAAERATGDQLATMSEEIAEMFAWLNDPQQFLVHDVAFHRAVPRHRAILPWQRWWKWFRRFLYERRRNTDRAGPRFQ